MTTLLRPLGLLLCAFGCSMLHAQTFDGENVGLISDGTAAAPGSYGAPLDVTFDVGGTTGTVESVVVAFSMNHAHVGDLKVRLIAPNGQDHLLFARTGAMLAADPGAAAKLVDSEVYRFGDAFTTNWWDAMPDGDADVASVDARTVAAGGEGMIDPAPATSMNAAFLSMPPDGTWTLRFEDGALTGTGFVAEATLTLTTVGTTRPVTTTADSGIGSLREQIENAQQGDRITFASPLFDTPQTIDLLTALPQLDVDLALQGPGANLLTVRRADTATNFPVFQAPEFSTSLSIGGMTISNGRDTLHLPDEVASGNGGGLRINGNLTLYGVHVTGNQVPGAGGGLLLNGGNGLILDSTFSSNTAGAGAAIMFQAGLGDAVRIVNTTISGNTATTSGAIHMLGFIPGQSRVDIVSSTIQGNASTLPGAVRVAVSGGASIGATLNNSIVANNPGGNFFLQVDESSMGGIESRGFNLADDAAGGLLDQPTDQVNANAGLAPLADNGGPTPTHALLPDSDAIDAGSNAIHDGIADQRGGAYARTADRPLTDAPDSDGTDVGAFEVQNIEVFADGFEDD